METIPVLFLEYLLAEAGIPERYIQVISFSSSGIDIIIKIGGDDKVPL